MFNTTKIRFMFSSKESRNQYRMEILKAGVRVETYRIAVPKKDDWQKMFYSEIKFFALKDEIEGKKLFKEKYEPENVKLFQELTNITFTM